MTWYFNHKSIWEVAEFQYICDPNLWQSSPVLMVEMLIHILGQQSCEEKKKMFPGAVRKCSYL